MRFSFFVRGYPRVSSSRLLLLVIASIALVNVAIADVPRSREVRLKTLGGKLCILGLEVTSTVPRDRSLKRFKIEVKSKGGKWRLQRKQSSLRARPQKGVYRILHRMERKALYRYTLVDKNGAKLSRPKVGRLSALPLCSRIADDIEVLPPRKNNDGDASGNSDTPIVPTCASLNQLLQSWGQSGACDLNSSGSVDGADLAIFLGSMK